MRSCGSGKHQHGAALIVALMMLIAVLALGTSSARMALQGEQTARNERDRQIALQAAEAALLDAESDIQGSPDPARSRSHLFAHNRAEGFVQGCGAGLANPHLGLCLPVPGSSPVWVRADFLDESTSSARTVPYGHFTGQTYQTGVGVLPARPPRYVIELLPFNMAGGGATGEDLEYLYRITAIGFGARASTRVVLQTLYRKIGT